MSGEAPQDGQQGSSGGAPSGDAANQPGDDKSKTRRKPRTPEEVLADIEAEKQAAIRKAEERAAQQRAEVTKKQSAAQAKAKAVELFNGYRAAVREALGQADLDDESVDQHIDKIMKAGIAGLTPVVSSSNGAEPLAPAATLQKAA